MTNREYKTRSNEILTKVRKIKGLEKADLIHTESQERAITKAAARKFGMEHLPPLTGSER